MRRLLPLLAVALLLASCGDDEPSVTSAQADDPVVVTALWPLAELAERIGGGRLVVVNLTPVGESPHELTLTPRQRAEVQGADLAIVVGDRFQPDVERAAGGGDEDVLTLVDELDLPDEPAGGHLWLDPSLYGSIATLIGEALAEIDPDGASGHRSRAEDVVEEMVVLDAQITDGLSSCERDVLVTQHDSFGWFAARYGLTAIGLDAAQPDEDPAPDEALVAEVEALLEDGAITTLFTETLLPPAYVEVVADERGLDTASLNPFEGLTISEDAREIDYESVMLENLSTLQEHLDCRSS